MPIGMRGAPAPHSRPERRTLFTTATVEKERTNATSAPSSRANATSAPSSPFVKVSHPGSPYHGRAGIVLTSHQPGVTWKVPTTVGECECNVMLGDTLETVTVDKRHLSPALSPIIRRRARPSVTIHTTPTGSRRDRSYTAYPGSDFTENKHANPEAIESGWKAFWKDIDSDQQHAGHRQILGQRSW